MEGNHHVNWNSIIYRKGAIYRTEIERLFLAAKGFNTKVATEFLWMTSLTFTLNIVFFSCLKPWQLYIFSLTYSEKHSFFTDFLGWSTCPNLTSPYSLAKNNFKRQWFDKHDCCNILKGYLCYKTITSQNVSFEAQIKNFLFHRKIMFCFQDIQGFVFLIIPWFTVNQGDTLTQVFDICIQYMSYTILYRIIK